MKDLLGREIIVGDQVVYATRQDSSTYMTVGDVISVEEGRVLVGRTFTTRWNRIDPDGTVSVRRYKDGAWDYSAREKARPVWVHLPHNIAVMERTRK